MTRFPLFAMIPALVIILSAPAPASAQSAYTPPGLYTVERVELPNGFHALLRQRSGTRSVSFRLVVRIGSRHFDCPRREIPHVIERLLFTGTSKHTGPELDRLIQEHGGAWSATTGGRYTVYTVDIFDGYADLALNTLFEIITDTSFAEDKVRTARDIAARENNGKPTFVRKFFYRYGIGKTAWTKAMEQLLPGTGAVCPGLPDPSAVKTNELIAAFKTAYVPGNMDLVVVGNFDRNAIIGQLRKTFGSLDSAPLPAFAVHTPPYPVNGPIKVSGTFAPFLGSSGYVGVAYRTAGMDSPDLPALAVLNAYLNKKFYEKLRIRNSLAYGPEASGSLRSDYGILSVSADVGASNAARVRDLVHDTLNRLKNDPLDSNEIEGVKRMLLLRWAQGCKTNAGTADFYVGNLADLEKQGGFRSYARGIELVTDSDVVRVAAEYMQDKNRVDVLGVPTMTYTQFYIFIASLVLVFISIIYVRLRRRALAKRRMLPRYIKKL
jgi:predicted Zn-dependent peptidase